MFALYSFYHFMFANLSCVYFPVRFVFSGSSVYKAFNFRRTSLSVSGGVGREGTWSLKHRRPPPRHIGNVFQHFVSKPSCMGGIISQQNQKRSAYHAGAVHAVLARAALSLALC